MSRKRCYNCGKGIFERTCFHEGNGDCDGWVPCKDAVTMEIKGVSPELQQFLLEHREEIERLLPIVK